MRELAAFIELRRNRDDLFLRKIARGVLNHVVFIAQRKHGKVGHGASGKFL
jgi:hypothetical protein